MLERKFLQRYEERVNNDNTFDFNKEFIDYCKSDVDILRRSMLKFREIFMRLENIDPLRYVTIASVCMSIYRSNYTPISTITVVPEYTRSDNFSKTSVMWLDYMESCNNIHIEHPLNGGEKEIVNNKKYKVDGFCKSNNTVYEFYWCFWHGCTSCYKANVINNKNQKDMGTLNKQTVEKRKMIRSAGYKHACIYECQLKNNKDYQKFIKKYKREVTEPLNPRDAFLGGRTNATKLLYDFKANECGRYADFCSLYPTVQFYKKYPI